MVTNEIALKVLSFTRATYDKAETTIDPKVEFRDTVFSLLNAARLLNICSKRRHLKNLDPRSSCFFGTCLS